MLNKVSMSLPGSCVKTDFDHEIIHYVATF